MFRFRGTCSVWERYRTDKALLPGRASHRRMPGTGFKGDPPQADDGGRGGVPHNKVPPSPGEEKGARSKTTQGEGMRSAGSRY